VKVKSSSEKNVSAIIKLSFCT